MVSTAGKAGKSVTDASKVEQDSFSEESYWWLLHERGDEGLKELEKEFIAGKDGAKDKKEYT